VSELTPTEQARECDVERVARAMCDARWEPSRSQEFLDELFIDEMSHEVFLKQATAAIATLQPAIDAAIRAERANTDGRLVLRVREGGR
jgi:hypothetical protein